MTYRRLIAFLLALCLVLPCLPLGTNAAESDSGTCGDGLTWSLTGESEMGSVLTISGSGAMEDYSEENPAPWTGREFFQVKIGADVTYVGSYAFNACNLYGIYFGGDAIAFAEDAFYGLSGAYLFYPAYNDTWTEDLLQQYGGRNLEWDTYLPDGVCGENVTWELNKETGVLTISGTGPMANFGMDDQPWGWSRPEVTTVIIEPGVTTIGSGAFMPCSNLTSVSIPDTVTHIYDAAFRGCPLTGLEIPDSVVYIGSMAFEGNACTSITVPAGVTELYFHAFAPSRTLESIEFLGDITYMDNFVLNDCANLTEVRFYGDGPATFAEYAFDGIDGTVYYPAGNDTWDAVIAQFDTITWVPFEVEQENPFSDVAENWYYYEPVLWAVEQGITNGLSATEFGPDEPCTRDQIVTFLWRAAGCPEPESLEHSFTDLDETRFYYKAVLWAVEQGITNGLTATTFGPSEPCTRDQVVTFLWRYCGKPESTIENPFEDVIEGKFYYEAVLWAFENGITTGKTDTTFEPSVTCTRGQIVTFLYRALAEE